MIKHISIILFIISIFLVGTCFAYDDTITHKTLTELAIDNPQIKDMFTKELGINKNINEILNIKDKASILDILREASKQEDHPMKRSLNHFYNPLTNGGLCDILTGLSNLDWATGYKTLSQENVFTWTNAREAYKKALTATNETDRETYLASTFESLGHVMHLLEDMGVPAHTRNDLAGHLYPVFNISIDFRTWLGNWYEQWVKNHDKSLRNYSAKSVARKFNNLEYYWDTNVYNGSNPDVTAPSVDGDLTVGLAEYTNANFFSKSTIFASQFDSSDKHYFPYPDTSSVEGYTEIPETIISEDGKTDTVIYLKKIKDGDTMYRLASVSYIADNVLNATNGDSKLYHKYGFILDCNVHEDYARKLIPKVVGYCSGLVEYFFRGRMDVSAVPVFEDMNGIPNQLISLVVKVKNSTPGESMANGNFSLYYRYESNGSIVMGKAAGGSLGIGGTAYETIPVSELKENSEAILYFTMAVDNPITVNNFASVKWTLVYEGALGTETNAVAAKVFPTPDDIAADWGKVRVNEEWEAQYGKTGYPDNHWANGSYWREGASGSHSYDAATGSLAISLLRQGNYVSGATCSSWMRNLSIPVTPATWIDLKYYTDFYNKLFDSYGRELQVQYVNFKFSNGWNIVCHETPIDKLGIDITGPQTITLKCSSGYIDLFNVFHCFEKYNAPTDQPVYLQEISLNLVLIGTLPGPSAYQCVYLESDYIRMFDASEYFSFS